MVAIAVALRADNDNRDDKRVAWPGLSRLGRRFLIVR
jgi:hypothetical protein